jgi:hypothetical protein
MVVALHSRRESSPEEALNLIAICSDKDPGDVEEQAAFCKVPALLTLASMSSSRRHQSMGTHLELITVLVDVARIGLNVSEHDIYEDRRSSGKNISSIDFRNS